MSDDVAGVVGAFVGLLAGFVFGLMAGCSNTTDSFQKEAVEHGYAHWTVDSGGKTTWHWNEPVKKSVEDDK